MKRRLVEKWLYEGLAEEELAMLPEELKERVRASVRELIEEGLRSAEEEGWIDGPAAVERMLERHAARGYGAAEREAADAR